MAISWSGKRRLTYGSVLLIVFILGGIFFYYKTLYRAPTCADGIKNGTETGIDCGGACSNICTTDTLSPIVLWSKAFLVVNDVYNLAAYIENPNINSKNTDASYEFKIFDDQNKVIATRTGKTFIPKNKRFIVFEPSLPLGTKKPKYVEFRFTSLGVWQKDSASEPVLDVRYSPLSGTSTVPRIEGTISNNTIKSVQNVELVALVFDNKENVIAVSRTFIDGLPKNTSSDFVFMWPRPFNLGKEICLNSVDLSLVLDRSGSMKSEGNNPPEPFTTVKETAKNFIKNLSDNDRVGIISFGTNAFQESPLSADKQALIKTIDSFNLATGTKEQQTNIGEGLSLASGQLGSVDSQSGSKKVLILLTDGIPTEPRNSQQNYPRLYAESIAQQIISSGTIIYTIGLGKDVNEGILKTIAGDSSRYFFAPTKETLSSVYSKIGTALCDRKPNAITIIYRTF